jgi:hypothetical protein
MQPDMTLLNHEFNRLVKEAGEQQSGTQVVESGRITCPTAVHGTDPFLNIRSHGLSPSPVSGKYPTAVQPGNLIRDCISPPSGQLLKGQRDYHSNDYANKQPVPGIGNPATMLYHTTSNYFGTPQPEVLPQMVVGSSKLCIMYTYFTKKIGNVNTYFGGWGPRGRRLFNQLINSTWGISHWLPSPNGWTPSSIPLSSPSRPRCKARMMLARVTGVPFSLASFTAVAVEIIPSKSTSIHIIIPLLKLTIKRTANHFRPMVGIILYVYNAVNHQEVRRG